MRRSLAQLVESCAARWEVSGSISGRVLRDFQVTYSLCPHSVALGASKINEYQRNFLGDKVWPARRKVLQNLVQDYV